MRRPRAAVRVRDLAREHTEDAIKTLVSVMNSEKSTPGEKTRAAVALLDRGWGKPLQSMDLAPHRRSVHELTDEELMAIAARGNFREPDVGSAIRSKSLPKPVQGH